MAEAVRLVPMTQAQFDIYLATAVDEYTESIASSGSMGRAAARVKAVADHERLLPDGRLTPDNYLWAVYTGSDEVGRLWVKVIDDPDGRTAFIYDLEVHPLRRRSGLGRAIMIEAELVLSGLGVGSIGLNVFGDNVGAQALYREMGYFVTAMQMRKVL